MNTPTELERTAYHEAGHVVASFLLHRRFGTVKVFPKENPSELVNGEVKHPGAWEDFGQPDVEITSKTRVRMESDIMVYLAGSISEEFFVGSPIDTGNETDYTKAVLVADWMTNSPEESEAYINWLWVRAKDLLSLPGYWAAIQALAKELSITHEVRPKRAREIIKQAIGEAQKTRLNHVH